MKRICLAFLIPLALLGSDSLGLNWHEVADEKNGLCLLEDIHELARSVDNDEFYDFIEEYEENRQWDDEKFIDLIERSSQVEKTVTEALQLNVWQVEGFDDPDTKAEALEVFRTWRLVQAVRFQKCLISNKPMEAYKRAHDLSQSGLKMMSAKGGTLHFLHGFSVYTKGLKLLDDLSSKYPSTEYEDSRVPLETLKEFYRDMLRHDYGSALKSVDYLIEMLEQEGHSSEHSLIDVQATKELITEAYQEALDNSFREPSAYETEKRERIESLIEERFLPENAMNAAGLQFLTLLNWHPEEIWALVLKRSSNEKKQRQNQAG